MVLIHLFIMNMDMLFLLRYNVEGKQHEQFFSKNRRGACREFFIVNYILYFAVFHVFVMNFVNPTSVDQNREMHIV